MKGKKCIKLLILCITCLLSLSLYSNVNAASHSWYDKWWLYDTGNGTWAQASTGSFVTISSDFYTNLIRFNNQNFQKFYNGDLISFSGTFMTLMDYYQNGLNAPAIIECPQPVMPVTTLSCEISSSHDVSAGQHFSIYSWTYTGTLDDNWDATTLQFRTYIKNNSVSAIRLYHGALIYNTGDDEVITNTQAIQSFNSDVSSYIGSVISANNTNSNNIQSVIQSFNNDFNSYRTNTYNQLAALGDDVSAINQYLQDKEDQEQQDRENIEEQSDTTDQEANSSGDEATQTGSSLFGAFTQLLSALTNVNATSCTLPTMQIYSLNLGNMNLCQYNIPPQIMGLVSIGMVFIIIPLGINLVKRMISLYKEITG